MTERMETAMVRMAWAKPSFKERLRYLFMAIMFYPLLKKKERKQAGEQISTEGDDVYPLF